eukprot:TRINITY_DN10425_c0_g1_i1.p1 TRINITY_DN10425_c0_g1~~TRINITY_DN10425_c0_g1_i1.p1  ORF type:complete len:782 (+),score=64.60 TRINITY_DN10425_c0_g1_i1:29-2374(+)
MAPAWHTGAQQWSAWLVIVLGLMLFHVMPRLTAQVPGCLGVDDITGSNDCTVTSNCTGEALRGGHVCASLQKALTHIYSLPAGSYSSLTLYVMNHIIINSTATFYAGLGPYTIIGLPQHGGSSMLTFTCAGLVPCVQVYGSPSYSLRNLRFVAASTLSSSVGQGVVLIRNSGVRCDIMDCVFDGGNQQIESYGLLHSGSARLYISNSSFNNWRVTATSGYIGGSAFFSNGSATQVFISNTTFQNNSCTTGLYHCNSGALGAANIDTLGLNNCTIQDNYSYDPTNAGVTAGALYSQAVATRMTNVVFQRNYAYSESGSALAGAVWASGTNFFSDPTNVFSCNFVGTRTGVAGNSAMYLDIVKPINLTGAITLNSGGSYLNGSVNVSVATSGSWYGILTKNYVCGSPEAYTPNCGTMYFPPSCRVAAFPFLPASASPSPSSAPLYTSSSPSPSASSTFYTVSQSVLFPSDVPSVQLFTRERSVQNVSDTKTELSQIGFGDFASALGNSVPLPSSWTTANQTTDYIIVSNSQNSSPSVLSVWTALLGNQSGSGSVTFSALFDPNATLTIVLPHSINYTLAPGAIKYTLKLINTPTSSLFRSVSDQLQWSTHFDCGEALGRYVLDSMTNNTENEVTTYSIPRPGAMLQLRIPRYAFIDNRKTFINHTLFPAPTRSSSSDGSTSIHVNVQWTFPYFASSLFYDPDLAIFGTPPRTSSTSPDQSNSNTTDLRILAAIVVPVTIGATICVCSVLLLLALSIIFFRQRQTQHKLKARKGAINFDNPMLL